MSESIKGPEASGQNVLDQPMHRFSSHDGVYFDVPTTHTVFSVLGSGAYGTVCAADVDIDNSVVALKKFGNPFSHILYAKRTLRELRFLRHLRHENVILIQSVYCSGKTREDIGDIYCQTEVMDTDLSYIIRSGQPITTSHVKFFLYQIFRGVKYIHSVGIIHRDLKPKNLLVSKTCDLKICDFGLARLDSEHPGFANVNRAMTEYVCTRWYRAPEVLCCWAEYSFPVDMWSIGCIIAEMLLRRTMFKGNSTIDQLEKILHGLGSPTPDEIATIPNDKARAYLENQKAIPKRDLSARFPNQDPELMDIMHKLLEFCPTKRLDVYDALTHPYMKELHDPDDEPCGEHISAENFAFERRKLDNEALRQELLSEILCWHPAAAKKLGFVHPDLDRFEQLTDEELARLEMEQDMQLPQDDAPETEQGNPSMHKTDVTLASV